MFPRLPSIAICFTFWLIYWKFVYCLFAEKTWGNVIAFFLLIYFLTLDLFYFPSVSRQPKVVLILIILHFSYKSCVYYIQFIWSIEDFSYEFFFFYNFRCVMISDCMFLSAIVTIFKCKLKLILLFQLMKFGFSFQVENCLNAIETSYFVIHQNNIRKQKGGYGGCNIWAATIHCQHWRKSELFKYTADWEWRKWPNCCARCEFFISIIIMIHCIISSSETLCLFGLVLGCRQSFFGM